MFDINKTKDYAKTAYDFALRFRDVRFTGQVLFAVIVLLISWSGVKAIQRNYELQQQIAGLKQQTDVQRLQTENLKLKNDYFKTNQYLELSARQNFGLANPGEKELIVPKDVAMAHTVSPLPRPTEIQKQTTKQPFYERNYQAWINFFLHRPADN
ncbi:MAG TPA: septum formation initiator family protein [Candidatus Saccharimonadales bacterium]|nr:septum formation initiator family protein [Candidatus Saccharimonadales bacterium]